MGLTQSRLPLQANPYPAAPWPASGPSPLGSDSIAPSPAIRPSPAQESLTRSTPPCPPPGPCGACKPVCSSKWLTATHACVGAATNMQHTSTPVLAANSHQQAELQCLPMTATNLHVCAPLLHLPPHLPTSCLPSRRPLLTWCVGAGIGGGCSPERHASVTTRCRT